MGVVNVEIKITPARNAAVSPNVYMKILKGRKLPSATESKNEEINIVKFLYFHDFHTIDLVYQIKYCDLRIIYVYGLNLVI